MESIVQDLRYAVRQLAMCSTLTAALVMIVFPSFSEAQRNPLHEARDGKGEIVAVFIIGPCCDALTSKLRPGLDRVRRRMAEQAKAEGVGFRMVGVALDWSPDSGWARLKAYGPFDEVTVGSNWLSMPIERLVWQDGATTPSNPQIVVYRHQMEVSNTKIEIGLPLVLHRIKGWKEIGEWGLDQRPIP